MLIEMTVMDAAILRLLLANAPWDRASRLDQLRVGAKLAEQAAAAWAEAGATFDDYDGPSVPRVTADNPVTLELSGPELRALDAWVSEVRVEPQRIGRDMARYMERVVIELLPAWVKRANAEDQLRQMPPEMRAALAREAKAAESANATGGLPDEEAK